MKNFFKIVTLSILLLPLSTYADVSVSDLIGAGYRLINNVLIPMGFSAALLYFAWGIAKYIRSVGNGKEQGRQIMIWGVVGMFVLLSIWGIIIFIRNEIGLEDVKVQSPGTVFTTDTNIRFDLPE